MKGLGVVGGVMIGLGVLGMDALGRSHLDAQPVALQVAVPDKATVTRKQGASLTGQLVGFTKSNVKLAEGSYAESVPLAQVRTISFEGNIWVEGRRLPIEIRGYRKIWPGVSPAALTLQNPPKFVNLDLKGIETPERVQKLQNPDKVRVLANITFESPQKMTVETFTMPKK